VPFSGCSSNTNEVPRVVVVVSEDGALVVEEEESRPLVNSNEMRNRRTTVEVVAVLSLLFP
jgi:hypothetical protein